MRLKFGPADPPAISLARRQSAALESSVCPDSVVTTAAPAAYAAPVVSPAEPSAKIIEFPRPLAVSQQLFDELVDDISLDLAAALTSDELFDLFDL